MHVPIAARIFFITLFAAVIGVVIPGWIAKSDGVFFREDFDKTIAKKTEGGKGPWLQQVAKVENYRRGLEEKELRLAQLIQRADVEDSQDLIKERTEIENELQRNPEAVVPFYGSLLVALWFWTFLAMGILLCVCPPGGRPWKDLFREGRHPPKGLDWTPMLVVKIVLLGAVILSFYEWPTWWRFFYGHDDPQYPPHTMYFNSHPISPWSDCYEMSMEGIYCLMLATVIMQWIEFGRGLRQEWSVPKAYDTGQDYLAMLVNPQLIGEIRDLFEEWVVVSVIFASSYMFDTIYYWHQVTSHWGTLYVTQAVLEHTVWAVGWLIFSAPFLMVLRYRSRIYGFALRQIEELKGGMDEDALRLIEQSRPLSDWILLLANLGAIVAFAVSLFHATSA